MVDTLSDYACVRSVTRDHRLYAGLSSVSILSDQATPDSDEKETVVCTHRRTVSNGSEYISRFLMGLQTSGKNYW